MTKAATVPTTFTTRELADRLAAELRGPADLALTGLDTLDRAGPGTLSFVRDPRNLEQWLSSRCGAALVARAALGDARTPPPGRAMLIVDDADHALIQVLLLLAPAPATPPPGVHPTAHADPSAFIAPDASVGPSCSVGPRSTVGPRCTLRAGVVLGEGVRLGQGCVLHPGVVVQDRCVIGDRVVLHPGVVIGADGFGYRPASGGGGVVKVPHIGIVEIEGDVEIGANSTIDRAKFGATFIGAGTKIDNLVHIGHNCRVGRSCIICGACGLSGSVVLGDGVTLAGGVGIADNRTIGAGAGIGARSGVMNDVPPGENWVGYPARPIRQTMRLVAAVDALPDLIPRLRRLLKGSGAP